MDTLGALKQVFIFKNVPDSVLQILAGAAEEISLAAGETIFSATDKADALYIIKAGTVRIVLDGTKAPPLLFGMGETLGEVPFLDGENTAVTATALERVDALVIRAGRVAAALAANPEAGLQFYRAIAKSLAGRLRRAAGVMALAKDR